MNKIKVSIVSYYNTIPFLYGFSKMPNFYTQIDLQKDVPSVCAAKLLSGEVDLGLIPVAEIPKLKNSYIISDYCIGAEGKVDTVMLFSKVPLEEIKTILLDYQSKTSVNLVKILCSKFWKISPVFEETSEGYENKIAGTTAAVIIGNRVFDFKDKFQYVFDLSYEWQKFTQMPFVFACWVSNKKLTDSFIEYFNIACKIGIENIPASIKNSGEHSLNIDLTDYLCNKIKFNFDDKKRQAVDLFLKYLNEI